MILLVKFAFYPLFGHYGIQRFQNVRWTHFVCLYGPGICWEQVDAITCVLDLHQLFLVQLVAHFNLWVHIPCPLQHLCLLCIELIILLFQFHRHFSLISEGCHIRVSYRLILIQISHDTPRFLEAIHVHLGRFYLLRRFILLFRCQLLLQLSFHCFLFCLCHVFLLYFLIFLQFIFQFHEWHSQVPLIVSADGARAFMFQDTQKMLVAFVGTFVACGFCWRDEGADAHYYFKSYI